jgi:hypothetical protein
MKILLGDFNAILGREGIFKPTIGNESLNQVNNNDKVVKSKLFTHRNIHKYTWTSADG